ncbi:methyltransferase TRM13 [Clostridium homopropionicum DSM 5847]|uniref:Methyltransferase TRM13 n=1 Tax=Clostridium homopropionicum DSM 5847 TaxID=1121318 RepID=A0A0L6ZCY2_9CLOT|nr:SAM-dependent methyltransferase [Clostridium homopropionicum]KOA20802.1 methyltransferase TRM13 [Clostridium homopropionicum DSM 5847]SFF88790.1 Methyltransferase domain-containing protein [Clostridium homopropionicum]
MNKQSLSKLKLFFMGIENRFSENSSIFKSIKTSYKTGLKIFNGNGSYENGKIKYNFNGKTETSDISLILAKILKDSESYEALQFIYSERGTDILISADNKNVTMKNVAINESDIEASLGKTADTCNIVHPIKDAHTSTLLNRDYYIKVGSADALLKEINIMTKDGKIKNDKIRKYNQIDHYVELLDGIFDKISTKGTLTILDCGCGKSYLSFVLNYYLTEVKKIKCYFIGLDYSEGVIESSRKMAQNLGYRNMEFHAIDIKNYIPNKKINIVLSLHACDTATDMALALGIRVNSDVIIAVPCCHRELLNQYSYEPFKSVTKHGVLKARLADILTDSMRATMLEAKGYEVSVVEYISPLETPKNLMIRAIKTKEENPKALEEYMGLMKSLNANPALYKFLKEW